VSDPFNILGSEFDPAPAFDEAVRAAVARLETAAARFEELHSQLPEDALTPEEQRVIDLTSTELEEAVERAEEGYVAVQYDGHAWYRIMESLEQVSLRLESSIGLMESVLARTAPAADGGAATAP
jgi:hypothetical protein